MSESHLAFVGIAPHPPVMVPEVGGEMALEVRASIEAMREMTGRVKACGAQTVALISPHAPLEERAFVAYDGPLLRGDFANFRAPQATVEAPLDDELLEALEASAAQEGYSVVRLRPRELDHGTAVPLYFLLRGGWQGRVVALGYSFLSNEDHVRFGRSVSRAVEEGVEAIRDSAPERVVNIDQGLRRLAGECGYRSMLVAFGVCADAAPDFEVLHYEAPFGVGYLVAQLARANLSER